MKILIVGNGGREHALAWKLAESEKVSRIFVAPGNGGTAVEAKTENIDIQVTDLMALAGFAESNAIGLTVVGPEIPLSMGIVDEFERRGLKVFGPCKLAAAVEYSKSFAKELMISAGVPTADYASFNNYDDAETYIKAKGAPIVVKADGLAAGKGVVVAGTINEALEAADNILNKAAFGRDVPVVVEEFLSGEELSFLAVTDGETILPLATSQDHKAVFDGDKGANTGGMGAYSPAFMLSADDESKLPELVIKPIIDELAKRGIKFKGILYAGLMLSSYDLSGVKVLEYNARFGDPETQVILPRMKTDLLDILLAVAENKLSDWAIEWHPVTSATVVMASGGYPAEYKNGYKITGIESADGQPDIKVIHAGTEKKDAIYTKGGRVLNVTAIGENLKVTLDKIYNAADMINFTDKHYRKDIGAKALKRSGRLI